MTKNASSTGVSRRRYLVAAGSVGLLAGCLDLIRGETLEFAASPSRVGQGTLDGTGYELDSQDEMEIERTFEAAGQSRDVLVRNVVTEYSKSIDMGPLGEAQGALFTSLTTPQVNILNREFNPVADMSAEDLAGMVQQQYDGIGNLRNEGETEISIRGETTTQTKFRADAAFDGSPVKTFLHVSEPVEMGDDFVVTVAAYPELTPREEENVLAMMEGVEPDE
jgi:hypothetical protein